MKKTLILGLVLLSSAASTFAQGTLNFANGAAGVNAPIVDVNGSAATVSGAAYAVDLFYGPAGISDPLSGQLTSLGIAVNLGTGASAGYFFGGTRTIPGFASGATITVQVRAWDTTLGATFAEAFGNTAAGNPAGAFGWSAPIQITLGGGTNPNPNMNGLAGFQLQPGIVPEPTSLALAGLGAASLLLFRRRK